MITVKHNTKKVIKQLQKQYGALEQTTAAAINEAAGIFADKYKSNLQKDFNVKNKFTLGSVQIFQATARRRSGEIRPMQKINAIVGVRKMKGGRDHYLKKQEEGGSVGGDSETLGKVPIPLFTARTGDSKQKPVAVKNRMIQKGKVQQLKLGGARFGYNDKHTKHGYRFNTRQRFAILQKYAKSGKWDLSKQFLFTGKKGIGVFAKKGSRIRMIRSMEKTRVKVRARHTMRRSTSAVTPQVMDSLFVKNAKRFGV